MIDSLSFNPFHAAPGPQLGLKRSLFTAPSPRRHYVQLQFITGNSSIDKATCINLYQVVLWNI